MILGPLDFSPFAFWLAPPVLGGLLWLRFYHTPRQELLAGSLMLWRRLAAQQGKLQPRRMRVDLSLVLQALALLLLIAALAAPRLNWGSAQSRSIVLAVDNGPLARAKNKDGKELWELVRTEAEHVIQALRPGDKVYLLRAAPLPALAGGMASTPSAALSELAAMRPALSGGDPGALWSYVVDQARGLGGENTLPLTVVSLRDSPTESQSPSASSSPRWRCVAPSGVQLDNVAIVAFGSALVSKSEVQVLVRIKNFSTQPVEGSVRLEIPNGDSRGSQEKELKLAATGQEAIVFAFPNNNNCMAPIRISWRRKDRSNDALPDDDEIVASPRPMLAPRVRFHSAASAPALERLFRTALNAVILNPEDKGAADLEVFVHSVPEEIPEGSRALLLLAPERGYQSIFDVGNSELEWPLAQRDEDDALTAGIGDKPEGIFPVPKACELLSTGNLKTLIKDSRTQRALAARFIDEKNRAGYVFAFIPGAGFPAGKLIEPELAVIFVRIALQAANAGEPFVVARAEDLEHKSGQALSANWLADQEASGNGAGVLNENTSALVLGRAITAAPLDLVPAVAEHQRVELAEPLIFLVMVLAGLEFWFACKAVRGVPKRKLK